MINLLLAASLHLPLPRAEDKCYGSPVPVATGNVPSDDTVAHSVVNIWAFLDEVHKPMAWMYKNASGEYFVQLSARVDQAEARSWKLPNALLKRPYVGSNYDIVRTSAGTIVPITTTLLDHGYTLSGCFRSDMKM